MPVFILGIRGWDSSQGCSSHQFGVDWFKNKAARDHRHDGTIQSWVVKGLVLKKEVD